MPLRRLLTVLTLTTGLAAAGAAQASERAEAKLMDLDGKQIGTVTFHALPSGGIWLIATAEGIAPGVHAFHIHETGVCEAGTGFKSAGGHYAPRGHAHGVLDAEGPHAGDFPNVHVQSDGVMAVEYFSTELTLTPGETGTLFDSDGSAVVMHDGADDYISQPAGAAGSRILCGVIEKS